jgi:hypothetical protein
LGRRGLPAVGERWPGSAGLTPTPPAAAPPEPPGCHPA